MNILFKTTCIAALVASSMSVHAFESFESYAVDAKVDTESTFVNAVLAGTCTDGKQAAAITYTSDAWKPMKVTLANSVDFTQNTHFSFDAIKAAGAENVPILVKLIDSNNKDIWYWSEFNQDGAAVYSLKLAELDKDNSDPDADLSDIVVVDFGTADSSTLTAANTVYIDNLRLSDGTATVGEGCTSGGEPTEPPENEFMINDFEAADGTDFDYYVDPSFGGAFTLEDKNANFTAATGKVWNVSWNADSADDYEAALFGGVGGASMNFSAYTTLTLEAYNNFDSNIDVGFRIGDAQGGVCSFEQYGFVKNTQQTVTFKLANCTTEGVDLSNVEYIKVYGLTWSSLQGSVQVDSVRGIKGESTTPPTEPEKSYKNEGGSLGGFALMLMAAVGILRRRK